MTFRIAKLSRPDMAAAALVHRAAFDERLPWLAGLHTPEEDQAYFSNHVFDACEVWGAWDGPALAAFMRIPRIVGAHST